MSSRPSSPTCHVSVGVTELLFPPVSIGSRCCKSIPLQNWTSDDQEIRVVAISKPFSTTFGHEILAPGSFILLPVEFEPIRDAGATSWSGSIVLEACGRLEPLIVRLKGFARI